MTLVEVICAGIVALGIGGTNERSEFACKYVPQVVVESNEMGFRPELMIALIHYESRWYPSVVSKANACGLTQVLPRYTGGRPYPRGVGNPKLTCKQLKDPTISITAGSRALRYWLKRYGKGNERVGLCGYNAGFRCKGKSPHKGGMKYSGKVVRMADKLRKYINLNFKPKK